MASGAPRLQSSKWRQGTQSPNECFPYSPPAQLLVVCAQRLLSKLSWNQLYVTIDLLILWVTDGKTVGGTRPLRVRLQNPCGPATGAHASRLAFI